MGSDGNLARFLEAQAADYDRALEELRAGRKRTHWIWYIFPQIRGLGFSETSKYYAIKDIHEAEEFLKHPVLGPGLINICHALLELEINNATAIFGAPDHLKLKSSMRRRGRIQKLLNLTKLKMTTILVSQSSKTLRTT